MPLTKVLSWLLRRVRNGIGVDDGAKGPDSTSLQNRGKSRTRTHCAGLRGALAFLMRRPSVGQKSSLQLLMSKTKTRTAGRWWHTARGQEPRPRRPLLPASGSSGCPGGACLECGPGDAHRQSRDRDYYYSMGKNGIVPFISYFLQTEFGNSDTSYSVMVYLRMMSFLFFPFLSLFFFMM